MTSFNVPTTSELFTLVYNTVLSKVGHHQNPNYFLAYSKNLFSFIHFTAGQPICLQGTQPQNMIQIFALTTNSRVNLSVYMMVFHCLFLNSDCRNITTTINACLLRIKGFTVLLLRSVLSSQIWKGMATCKASGRVLLGRVVSVP